MESEIFFPVVIYKNVFMLAFSTGGQPRDEVIAVNERLRCVRIRLDESYRTAKSSLIQLHERYNDSKLQSSIRRYAFLKAIIKASNWICHFDNTFMINYQKHHIFAQR